jgi:fatty acid CoA ligase FadD36
VVPLPPDSGPAEVGHILSDSGADLLLLDRSAEPPATHLPTLRISTDGHSPGAAETAAPDGPALVLYTSGTTGAPKGVLLSRAALVAGLDALAEAWRWSPDDTLVHGLPLFHVHGLVLGVLGALRHGSRLVHTGRPTPAGYATAGGSLYFGVPTVWSRIVADQAAARALAPARLLVSGSAPLPVPVFDALRALTGHAPVERYGMTETLITVSARADGERLPGCVGTPLAGVDTRLAGEDDAPVPHDGASLGELQVRGPTLFDGYLGRPEATAASYTDDGWFRTGDIATVDDAGRHRIVGRASQDLIKTGGYRVGAGEVENVLLGHPAVREAAVIGVANADLGQEIVAYVVGSGVSGPELTDFVAKELSWHKRPRRVELVDSLPRNALGKVQKSLLG